MTKIAIATSVAALAVLAAPAQAQSGAWRVGPDQIHLYYADIDVNSAAGRASLLRRVEKAAVKLCRELPLNDRRMCEHDTMRRTSKAPAARMLALAMTERDAVAVALK